MKYHFGILPVVFALQLAPSLANAQAPSSIAGSSLLINIRYGTYPLASSGYFLFLPADSGNQHQTIGIYGVADASGTYSYSKTTAQNGQMSIWSTASGSGTAQVGFSSETSGTFDYSSESFPGLNQGGDFIGAVGTALPSIVGRQIYCAITDGQYPFAPQGTFTIAISSSGNSYIIYGSGGAVGNSSGSYSYSIVNRSTGAISLNDSVTGPSTAYIAFSDPSTGRYAVKSPSGGFQIASFRVVDVARPTVSIYTPSSPRTYTNAQTVMIRATASDDLVVTRVEFYDNGMLKASDTTSPYDYSWSFTASNNASHVWTARAYDAVGNISTSAPVNLDVKIDITSPSVSISSPINGASVFASPVTIAGTAKDPGWDASGLASVQVRVNGGGWSNALGTTSWTMTVLPAPCTLTTVEARSVDKVGQYSPIASGVFTYFPPNTVPLTPVNVFPPNGMTAVSAAPVLQASPFSDSDCSGDTHTASHWQVFDSTGANPVCGSSTTTVHIASWQVPEGALCYGSNYQWHVRYRDSRNGWSSFSPWTRFTVVQPQVTGMKLGSNMILRWPTNAIGFNLQWSTNLVGGPWSNSSVIPKIVNGQYTITNNVNAGVRFYRLRR